MRKQAIFVLFLMLFASCVNASPLRILFKAFQYDKGLKALSSLSGIKKDILIAMPLENRVNAYKRASRQLRESNPKLEKELSMFLNHVAESTDDLSLPLPVISLRDFEKKDYDGDEMTSSFPLPKGIKLKIELERRELVYAIHTNNVELVRVLLKSRVNTDFKINDDLDPLSFAIKRNADTEIIDLLEEYNIRTINKRFYLERLKRGF